MAGVVNLRAARKARDRAAKRAEADQNAAKFGRSKAERTRDEAEADKARRELDGHERE
jgi:hypothetical protein